MGNHLAKNWVYTDKTLIYVSLDGTNAVQPAYLTDERHLNATIGPDDPTSATNFAYETTDGSNDAPYIKSN